MRACGCSPSPVMPQDEPDRRPPPGDAPGQRVRGGHLWLPEDGRHWGGQQGQQDERPESGGEGGRYKRKVMRLMTYEGRLDRGGGRGGKFFIISFTQRKFHSLCGWRRNGMLGWKMDSFPSPLPGEIELYWIPLPVFPSPSPSLSPQLFKRKLGENELWHCRGRAPPAQPTSFRLRHHLRKGTF